MALANYNDLSINLSNRYNLRLNESPPLILVATLLDNINYHSWTRFVHIALISKNKEKFIYGTLPKPNASDLLYSP